MKQIARSVYVANVPEGLLDLIWYCKNAHKDADVEINGEREESGELVLGNSGYFEARVAPRDVKIDAKALKSLGIAEEYKLVYVFHVHMR